MSMEDGSVTIVALICAAPSISYHLAVSLVEPIFPQR
jgi:hypothetical protein